MNRILIAFAAVALGAGAVVAASPEVDKAIKAIQAVGADANKMQSLCAIMEDDEEEEEAGAAAAAEKAAPASKEDDADDAAAEKEYETAFAQLGPAFKAAWEVGEKLDENSADGKEYAAAVEAVSAKCE